MTTGELSFLQGDIYPNFGVDTSTQVQPDSEDKEVLVQSQEEHLAVSENESTKKSKSTGKQLLIAIALFVVLVGVLGIGGNV